MNATPPVITPPEGNVTPPVITPPEGNVTPPANCSGPFCRNNLTLSADCAWDDTNVLGDVACCTSTDARHTCWSLFTVDNYWTNDLSTLCS